LVFCFVVVHASLGLLLASSWYQVALSLQKTTCAAFVALVTIDSDWCPFERSNDGALCMRSVVSAGVKTVGLVGAASARFCIRFEAGRTLVDDLMWMYGESVSTAVAFVHGVVRAVDILAT
jgi:hypothetical protein